MKPLPLPLRVAAGLAVTAVDRARQLPEKLAELPVTVVSQALQLSMRVQQQVTELAIKGDGALSALRPVEESPEWATFDEDKVGAEYDASPVRAESRNNGARSRFDSVEITERRADRGTTSSEARGQAGGRPGPAGAADLRRADAAAGAGPAAPVRRGPTGRVDRVRTRPRQPGGLRRDVDPATEHRARSAVTDPQATTSGQPTSPESPWPVRTVARKIAEWINRLGTIWVEGQVTQISARPGTATAFITLRDPSADVSLSITCPTNLLRGGQQLLAEGSQVVVHGKPTFYINRGSLSLRVDEIRAVGIGELLARIERLRRLLAAEGLFEPARKRKLPFLPGTIGLITGRASAAEHDVLTNAQRRWPAVRFRVENVAVQGPIGGAADPGGALDAGRATPRSR